MEGVALVEEDALPAEGVAVVAEVGHVGAGRFLLAEHPALLRSLDPRQQRHYVVVHLAGEGVEDAHSIRQTCRKRKIIIYKTSRKTTSISLPEPATTAVVERARTVVAVVMSKPGETMVARYGVFTVWCTGKHVNSYQDLVIREVQ